MFDFRRYTRLLLMLTLNLPGLQQNLSLGTESACGLRALCRLTRPAFEAHPGATTFPPVAHHGNGRALLTGPPASPQAPLQCPRSRAATLELRGAGGFATWPLRRPDRTWSRLHSREYDWPVTQPTATPEPRCHGTHLRSSRSSLRPWVCHHTREPTVLSRVSCLPFP